MSSPSIPRSLSDPALSKTLPSSSRSRSCPSTYSVPSSSSSKKSRFWGKKVGWFINCKKSELTEESLEAHNIRNQEKNATNKCSPYYKGLTDSSLVTGRQRHHPIPMSSPGRESYATTAATSIGSFSTFMSKMQDWTFCFTFKSKQDDDCYQNFESSAPKTRTTKATLVKEVVSEIVTNCKDDDFSGHNLRESHSASLVRKKPLRERVSQPQPQPAPAPTPTIVVDKDTNERKFMWASKYQPKSLKDFICNRDKARQLKGLVKAGECSHFIFEGPPGVGKRTMIWAFLQETFGADRVQVYISYHSQLKAILWLELQGESIGSIQVNVKESSQHVEVNLSTVLKGYEKHVIVELIKERHNKISNTALQSSGYNCRAIILYGADKLSTDALLYIRWLLERYKGYNKVFFCCSDVSKLQPIKTLCTIVQLFPPSNKEIVEVLEFIAKEEGIELPHQLAEKIANNSKNNLRQAIRSFEATWQINYSFAEDQVIMTGWEDDIANIAKNIVEEQSPKQLYVIRGKLQNLIEHNVSPDFIFKMDSEASVLEGEKPLVFVRNRHDEMGKWLHDPLKKNVQLFMRIEARKDSKAMDAFSKLQACKGMESKARETQKNELTRTREQASTYID
ncbi:hypothetical protein L1049_018354 [Liquidambar formosana]|uniref:Replication factor C subunit 3 n=1 Tax=Liquidambar formosana TaxID=63359 RepID=A0AAP0R9Y5_LIQFO